MLDEGHQPIFRSPPVVPGLIAVLVAIHAGLSFAGENWQVWSLYALAFIPARYGSEAFPMIAGSQIWGFITYAFLHADWMHLLFNCLWLLIFGTVVARFLGPAKFLLLSAASAAGGALVTLVLHWGQSYVMIGASGADSGLMAAAVPIIYGRETGWAGWSAGDPATTQPLSIAGLMTNRNAIVFTAVWLAITLFSGATGFTGNSFMAGGQIAWEAHIGGFISGLAAFYLLRRQTVRG